MEMIDEARDERVFQPHEAAAGQCVRDPRQQVLRQEVLESDEQARTEAFACGAHVAGRVPPSREAARPRSALKAATSKGGVNTALMRASSTRNTTAEWSMV